MKKGGRRCGCGVWGLAYLHRRIQDTRNVNFVASTLSPAARGDETHHIHHYYRNHYVPLSIEFLIEI